MQKKGIIVISILLLVLFGILIVFSKNRVVIDYIPLNQIEEKIDTDGCSFLYTKELNKKVKTRLKTLYNKYLIKSYYSNLSVEEIESLTSELDNDVTSDDMFIVFMNGKVIDVLDSNINDEDLTEMIYKYLYNKIPKKERYYQVVSTANEYIEKVNSNKYTVAVFGSSDCTYCDLYLPVINKIAKDKKLDIYYFDKNNYDEVEYEKIMELDFEIPARCTKAGVDTTLKKGFPKPITIITKKGEFVDCIRGYVEEDTVLEILKKYKIVKE